MITVIHDHYRSENLKQEIYYCKDSNLAKRYIFNQLTGLKESIEKKTANVVFEHSDDYSSGTIWYTNEGGNTILVDAFRTLNSNEIVDSSYGPVLKVE